MRNFLIFILVLVLISLAGFYFWTQIQDNLGLNDTPDTTNNSTPGGSQNNNGANGQNGTKGTDGTNGTDGNSTTDSQDSTDSTDTQDGTGVTDNGSGDNGVSTQDGSSGTTGGYPSTGQYTGKYGALPSTALISDKADRILFGVLAIVFALILIKTDILRELYFKNWDLLKGDLFGVEAGDPRVEKQIEKIKRNVEKKNKR